MDQNIIPGSVLAYIAQRGPVTAREIAKALNLPIALVNKCLDIALENPSQICCERRTRGSKSLLHYRLKRG